MNSPYPIGFSDLQWDTGEGAGPQNGGSECLEIPADGEVGLVVAPCGAALHPPVVSDLGVPLFQEQLLRIAMVAAGFTGGEAEELQRAMSQERMVAIEAKLRAGMTERGISGPRVSDDRNATRCGICKRDQPGGRAPLASRENDARQSAFPLWR